MDPIAAQEITKVEPACSSAHLEQLSDGMQARMEPISVLKIIKVEPTDSNEHLGQLSDDMQARMELITGQEVKVAPMSSNGPSDVIEAPVHKYSCKEQQKNDFHPVVKACLSNETGEARVSGNKRGQCRKVYKCEICDRLFKWKYSLQLHVLKWHSKNRSVECKNCKEKFYNKTELIVHRKHCQTGEVLYQWTSGMKTLSSERILDGHRQIYSGETPYQGEQIEQLSNGMQARMELIKGQEIIIVQPTSSSGHLKLKSDGMQAPVPEDSLNERPQSDFLLVEKACFSNETGEAHFLGNKRGKCRKVFKCEICDRLFKWKCSLQRHVLIWHSKNRSVECKNCNKEFCNRTEFIYHRKCCHRKILYQCETCKKTFSSEYALDSHRQIHYGEPASLGKPLVQLSDGVHARMEPIKDQEIIKVETSSSDEHLELLSGDMQGRMEPIKDHDIKVEPCCPNEHLEPQNGMQSPVEEECLNEQHKSDFHPVEKAYLSNETGEALVLGNKKGKNKRIFKCEICEQLFQRKCSLQQHMLQCHTKNRSYDCGTCKEKFYDKTELIVHRQGCNRESEKLYQCNICMKDFNGNFSLNEHKITHTGEKPYECELCQKRFTAKSSLKCHRRLHIGERRYQCNVCLKKFISKYSLNEHERVHTGERPFECEICSRKFGARNGLKVHRRIHTGERPYECDFCQKKFSNYSGWSEHRRIHTGENPYQCQICMKEFKVKSRLNRHLRRVHKTPKRTAVLQKFSQTLH